MKRHSDIAIFQRLLGEARPYWWPIALIFLLGLAATPLALLNPLPLKIAVDSIVGSDPLPGFLAPLLPDALTSSTLRLLVFVAILQILIVLLIQLQDLATHVLRTWAGERLVLTFRARLFHHMQRLSLSFHDTRGTADSTYRIQYDAPSIQWLTIYGVVPLLSSAVMLVGMMYVMARIDLQIALVAFAVSPVLYFAGRSFSQRMRPHYKAVKELESNALKVVQEVLGALRVVKAFGREENEHGRFVESSRMELHARIRIAFSEGLFGLLVNLTVAIGTGAILYIGVHKVQAGSLTLGELLVAMAYLAQLFGPLAVLSNMVMKLQSHLVSARRAFEIFDELPEVAEKPAAQPLARAAGAIEFRSVSFGYMPGIPVLHDVSFAINPGARVGVLGPTGEGKTTLVSLLTRLYDPDSGEILLDGTDIREYKLADLRSQFAIVLQEPVLFSTTIAENIAYGRPDDASEEEIIGAAKAANAHYFIVQLPQGYSTLVGERGMSLSGGERQRISLARAFLKDAPILILDEPTSSVDVKTEAVIMETMTRLMHGRTTFMIAHRLSTMENCDRLLVVENGRVSTITSDMPTTVREVINGMEPSPAPEIA